MFVELQLKASLVNIDSFASDGEEFLWQLKIKCSSCGEVPDHFIHISQDESAVVKGRGSANLAVKCKMCGRENSMTIVDGSVKPYSNTTNQFGSVVKFECRGMEPVDFQPHGAWIATGSDSQVVFKEVDLSDNEWCDYDEKEGREVGIYELESQFIASKK